MHFLCSLVVISAVFPRKSRKLNLINDFLYTESSLQLHRILHGKFHRILVPHGKFLISSQASTVKVPCSFNCFIRFQTESFLLLQTMHRISHGKFLYSTRKVSYCCIGFYAESFLLLHGFCAESFLLLHRILRGKFPTVAQDSTQKVSYCCT